MENTLSPLLSLAGSAGFSHVGALNVAALKALPEVRDMCASGRCQVYGHCWSCPPACGSLDYAAKRLSAYEAGVLVQTTGELEDDFDYEAIGRAHAAHQEHFSALARQARLLCPDCLPLTAGGCRICLQCTYPKKPCRFPQRMLSSMEAYGLLVSDVCEKSGLAYNYGPKTITFTSCILFHTER